jgi:hypothetical protein
LIQLDPRLNLTFLFQKKNTELTSRELNVNQQAAENKKSAPIVAIYSSSEDPSANSMILPVANSSATEPSISKTNSKTVTKYHIPNAYEALDTASDKNAPLNGPDSANDDNGLSPNESKSANNFQVKMSLDFSKIQIHSTDLI